MSIKVDFFSSLTVAAAAAAAERRLFLRRVYLSTNLVALRIAVVRHVVVDPLGGRGLLVLVEGVVALVLLPRDLRSGLVSGLDVVVAARVGLLLEDELDGREHAHEDDEDEDDDEEVDGEDVLGLHDAGDRDAENDQPENLEQKWTKCSDQNLELKALVHEISAKPVSENQGKRIYVYPGRCNG